ncbi:two component transcriptional regulator, winged helix family [Duganella sacchari]|uniref:Two component transcriptional regulator, winged helix family n=2 Tax=Duganella sacchari TaxID=551987 RepID=A0A1M7LG55_9BURK|nr:two component transcriptional regulator, winged helix family [Duganella sacchari]
MQYHDDMSMNTELPGASGDPDLQALVLVAEDESEIAQILMAYLSRAGLRVAHAPDGRRALEMHDMLKPDLVLLDVQMPQLDGWSVLSQIRQRGNTAVIMLTAMDQDLDKLMGLRIGADDYVVKPFNPAEVVARTQAVLRRTAGANAPAHKLLRVEGIEIDLDHYEAAVCIDNTPRQVLALTLTEFRLLAHMARAPKRVFSRAELLAACLPEGETLERTVDSHLSKLRKKVEAAGISGLLEAVRGVGYRLGSGA